MNIKLNEIDSFGDIATWDLICSGRTKGVFQLESRLGQSWAKRVSPRNIEELADLISIIRPGTLEAMLDGKSMTKHYVDRKTKRDETVYLHEALEPILKPTYGIIVYQEQAMKIATDIAGFSPEEADSLRKAMGKKDAALMKEVREKFINGAKQKGLVQDQDAAQIFDWIQASARYSFNKSHAVAYAINSFRSAYCKAHDPIKFYQTYLNNASNKPDPQTEIKELIMDAKLNNIEVYAPRISNLYSSFTIDREKNIIYFGYSNIKNVGESEKEKIKTVLLESEKTLGKSIQDFNWLEIMFLIGNKIKKNAFISMISVGTFIGNNNKRTRNRMIFEYDLWNKLTKKEQGWIYEKWLSNKDSYLDFIDTVKDCINNNHKITVKRSSILVDIYQTLENPPYTLTDDPSWIADIEEQLMGCSLTCNKVDGLDIHQASHTCKEIINEDCVNTNVCVAVKINRVNEYAIKSGKSEGKVMGFLSIEDSSGELDSVVIFPEEFIKFKKLLFSGNTILLYGDIQQKKDKTLVIQKVFQI